MFTIVFHLEKKELDCYSGSNLNMDDIVKVCRNFKVDSLIIINETGKKISILDETFSWQEFKNLAQFEKQYKGDVFLLEPAWESGHDNPISEFQFDKEKNIAFVIGPTRGLIKNDKHRFLCVPQNGLDAFYPKDIVTIVAYQRFLKLWLQ